MGEGVRRVGSGRPPVVGVFTADLFDAYQVALFRGIQSEARRLGIGVVSFVGSRVHSPRPSESTANFAYGLADRESIDGLIVISSVIGTFLSPHELRRIFENASDLPRVSVGARIPGVASVVVDGTQGVREVVNHLAKSHGRRSFAVIGGPSGHQEAIARLEACRNALADAGLPVQSSRFVTGLFEQDSGARATTLLLERGATFDALVCMNDRMAIGAMQTLRRHGIRVPEDVAVTGFDDIAPARLATPPLTTVGQPLDALGATAIRMMKGLLNDVGVADQELEARVILRESCGCIPAPRSRARPVRDSPAAPGELPATVEQLAAVGADGDPDVFSRVFRTSLNAMALSGRDVSEWNGMFPALESRMDELDGSRSHAEVIGIARELAMDIERRQQAERRTAVEERFSNLQSVSASLMGAFEIPELLERLSDGLKLLGIDGCYLSLLDGNGGDFEWSRLVFTTDERPPGAGAKPVRYRTVELVPAVFGDEWRTNQWVLEPLVFQYEPLGFLLLPGDVDVPAVYDSFRDSVATALKGALLLEQVRGHEHRLEAQVARRTAELSRANRELVNEIERRVRLEQEVIDISNRTMERIGQDLHDDLCQYLAGISMHASAALKNVQKGQPAIETLEQISALLEDAISRAKQIARGLVPTGLEADGLVTAVETLVRNVSRNHGLEVAFTASREFSVADTDLALQIYRIIQEALNNAVRHSGSEDIAVRLYTESPVSTANAATGAGAAAESVAGPASEPVAGAAAESGAITLEANEAGAGATARFPASRRTANVGTLVFEVVDRGCGLSPGHAVDGMGLRIMRYRAEKIEAALEISDLRPGTRVLCRVRPGRRAGR